MSSFLLFAALSTLRQVAYPGADFAAGPIPKFDKGYLLRLERPCVLTVHQPSGNLQFRQELKGPGGVDCHGALDAAADTDGTIAVSLNYTTPAGYAGGVLLLDATGKQIRFIDAKRHVSEQVGFDHDHNVWTIGWQRDEVRNTTEDSNDYALVRRYSKAGTQTGAFIPRSLWKTTGAPFTSVRGYWTMAFAKDRIGAIVNQHFDQRTPEWIEWDLNGNLIARTNTGNLDGGRAYTASGRLFAGIFDEERKQLVLSELDRQTGAWTPVSNLAMKEWGFLFGADGEDLVFRQPPPAVDLVWKRVER